MREKQAKASLRERELGLRQGVLVHAADVGREVDEQFAVLKSRLTQMPARLVDQLAAESDEDRCRQVLQEELGEVLSALSAQKVLIALLTRDSDGGRR